MVGVHEPYSNGSQLIKNLFDQEVSPTMIYRLTDKVGEQSESIIAELDDSGKRSFGEQEGMCVNVALDGSMILTREEKWKECKLGRVYQQETSKTKEDNAKVKFLPIREEYAVTLGKKDEFTERIDKILGEINKDRKDIVFLSDGAAWIRNYIKEKHSECTHILDFYHLMSYIGEFVETLEPNKNFRKQVCEKVGFYLKKEGIESALRVIEESYKIKSKKQKEAKKKLDSYIESNKGQIDYPLYLSRGLQIGSGAVESAHRTLVQKRMKLSGQRWSKKGAKRLLNLRELTISKRWDDIKCLFKKAA